MTCASSYRFCERHCARRGCEEARADVPGAVPVLRSEGTDAKKRRHETRGVLGAVR